MKSTLLFVFVFLCLLSHFVAAAGPDNAQQMYEKRCGNCHGPDGAGKTAAAKRMPMPDLRSTRIQSMSDDQLFQTVAQGANHKSYPHVFLKTGLSEPQVRQLVDYMRVLARRK